MTPAVRLYHGSNVRFRRPLVELSILPCDFGKGFYTAKEKESARLRGREKRTTEREYYVMEFNFEDELAFGKLSVLHLDVNEEWAKFVMENRTGLYNGPRYDLVIGPSADGNTDLLEIRYKIDCELGSVDLGYYLRHLKPGIYGEQWVFTSQQAVDEFINLNNVEVFR